MLCPYCRTPYTTKQPCFCQSAAAGKKPAPAKAPSAPKASEYQAICTNSSRAPAVIAPALP
jgi:hypothetical protein